MSTWLKTHAKAIASGVVTLAAYLAGVIPAEGGPADLTWGQWFLAVVALGGAYGITATIPNHTPDVLARLTEDGDILAGEAAIQTTGKAIPPAVTIAALVPDTEDDLEEETHAEPPYTDA